MPAKRKAKPRKTCQPKRAKRARNLAACIMDLHKRVAKLENRERTVAGFSTCVVASDEADCYRELEEIEQEDAAVLG